MEPTAEQSIYALLVSGMIEQGKQPHQLRAEGDANRYFRFSKPEIMTVVTGNLSDVNQVRLVYPHEEMGRKQPG